MSTRVIFFAPDASSVVVTERSSEEEKRMTADDVRWDQYPTVASGALSRAWLTWHTAAVDDGVTACDHLLTQLADVPTPAGPTPRQLQGDVAPAAIDKRRA